MSKHAPLLSAVRQGQLAKVQELIRVGANPNARTKDGRTALHLAVEQANRKISELLLKSGADLNAQDSEGIAPAESAIMVGDTSMFKFLLAQGANPRINSGGYGLLHAAAATGNREITKTLISLGGASNVWQYLRKAEGFARNLRGATVTELDDGARRYVKNGYYLIKDKAGKILSYGRVNE